VGFLDICTPGCKWKKPLQPWKWAMSQKIKTTHRKQTYF